MTASQIFYHCPTPNCVYYCKRLKRVDRHVQQCIPDGSKFNCTICADAIPKENFLDHMKRCSEGPIAMTKLCAEKSRAPVSLSDDRKDAIVKRVSPKGRKHEGQCKVAVDANKLYHLRCTLGCPHVLDMSDKHARIEEYLWCRRRTRKTLGLLTASVPLDAQSFVIFDHTAKSCGIISNTSTVHLTLVDGYRLYQADEHYYTWFKQTLTELKSLRKALHDDPTLRVESLHTLPRLSDGGTHLVVANVSASFNGESIQKLTEQCALPQFPLHIAVGTCSLRTVRQTLELASQRLVGLSLKLDVRFLAVLAPSLDNKYMPAYPSRPPKNSAAVDRANAIFGQAASSAIYAANEINQMLYQSSSDI